MGSQDRRGAVNSARILPGQRKNFVNYPLVIGMQAVLAGHDPTVGVHQKINRQPETPTGGIEQAQGTAAEHHIRCMIEAN
jgi:hypothetical protein